MRSLHGPRAQELRRRRVGRDVAGDEVGRLVASRRGARAAARRRARRARAPPPTAGTAAARRATPARGRRRRGTAAARCRRRSARGRAARSTRCPSDDELAGRVGERHAADRAEPLHRQVGPRLALVERDDDARRLRARLDARGERDDRRRRSPGRACTATQRHGFLSRPAPSRVVDGLADLLSGPPGSSCEIPSGCGARRPAEHLDVVVGAHDEDAVASSGSGAMLRIGRPESIERERPRRRRRRGRPPASPGVSSSRGPVTTYIRVAVADDVAVAPGQRQARRRCSHDPSAPSVVGEQQPRPERLPDAVDDHDRLRRRRVGEVRAARSRNASALSTGSSAVSVE